MYTTDVPNLSRSKNRNCDWYRAVFIGGSEKVVR